MIARIILIVWTIILFLKFIYVYMYAWNEGANRPLFYKPISGFLILLSYVFTIPALWFAYNIYGLFGCVLIVGLLFGVHSLAHKLGFIREVRKICAFESLCRISNRDKECKSVFISLRKMGLIRLLLDKRFRPVSADSLRNAGDTVFSRFNRQTLL